MEKGKGAGEWEVVVVVVGVVRKEGTWGRAEGVAVVVQVRCSRVHGGGGVERNKCSER